MGATYQYFIEDMYKYCHKMYTHVNYMHNYGCHIQWKICTNLLSRLGATVTILRTSVVVGPTADRKSVSEVLVRKVPDDQPFLDLRLAVLGPMEAGKSTLLGALTQGDLDNGHGRARLNLFRHLHEIQSGRTSSISHEILGFDSKGEVVDYSMCISAEEICEASSKLITFIDLAGHQKYMKTTIFGLTAHCPDFAMLVIGANSGVGKNYELFVVYYKNKWVLPGDVAQW